MRRPAGTHGSDRAREPRQAHGGDRLRTHAGCTRQGAPGAAGALPRRPLVRVRLRRRPGSGKAPADGRGRGRPGRPDHRHRRQSTLGESPEHHAWDHGGHQVALRPGHQRPQRGDRHRAQRSRGRRHGADRRQGSRGLPDLRRRAAELQRPDRSTPASRSGGMKRTTGDAARVLGGQLIGEDLKYGVVSSDSRTLPPGALFVALRGPNFDGADFAAAAAARGAVAALVERRVSAPLTQIVVPDALRALQQLASSWRADFDFPIVGVAGSNGKTTAKTMTGAILSRMGSCLATQGNLNNHIGVPLTLMGLEPLHRSAVVEMGANRIGDVAELVKIARPTIGLITNAGAEHLEGFGDLDGVAKGEGEMVAGLSPEATAIINADDPYAGYWRSVASAGRIVTFGAGVPADFAAKDAVQSIEHG